MKVLIGIPSYDGLIPARLHSVLGHTSRNAETIIKFSGSSFLTLNFNQLWAEALNLRESGLTHFCMLHSDIVPETYWLDKLLKISEEKEADILSVISPIKDARGLTSCAIDRRKFDDNPEDEFLVTRLTMKNIHSDDMLPTFSDQKLLINTGLMLIDFRKPWVEKIRFHILNEIKKINGQWKALAFPEDWLFSRHARELGATIFATREVKLDHLGKADYSNAFAWGTHQYDRLENK